MVLPHLQKQEVNATSLNNQEKNISETEYLTRSFLYYVWLVTKTFEKK